MARDQIQIRHRISIKKIWAVAKTEWLRWVIDPRMLIIPVLAVFIYTFAVEPLMIRSEKMGAPLNLLEPLIAVGNSGQLALIMPIVFLTLMSDFPRTGGSTAFMISRTGRRCWAAGQILFSIMAIVTYLGAIYFFCTAFIMSRTFLANGWSMVVKKYVLLFPDEAHAFATELVPGNLYNQLTPFSAALQTYLLQFLYLMVLSLIMLIFNLRRRKGAGFLTAAGVIGFGGLLCSLRTSAMWAFPMGNSIVWLHFTEIYRKSVIPVWFSYVYFAVLIAGLLIAVSLTAPVSNILLNSEEE